MEEKTHLRCVRCGSYPGRGEAPWSIYCPACRKAVDELAEIMRRPATRPLSFEELCRAKRGVPVD